MKKSKSCGLLNILIAVITALFCVVSTAAVTSFAVDASDCSVTDVNVFQSDSNAVKISWSADGSWDYFELYRSDGSAWKKVKNVYSAETYNYNLQEAVDYQYRIRACSQTAGGIVFSSFSAEVSFVLGQDLAEPENLSIAQSGTHWVSLKWDAVEDADQYALYRSDNGSSWKKIKILNQNSASNYNLSDDVEYGYKVSAIKNKGTDKIYSNASAPVYLKMNDAVQAPANISVKQATGSSVYLSWDAVEGADSYALYRSVDNGSWVKVKNVTGNTTYNYNLKQGTLYQYKVCVNKYNGSAAYSGYSDTVSITLASLAAPEGLSATVSGKNRAYLKWNEVAEADGYVMYRKDGSGDWKKIKSVTGCEAYNYNLADGEVYQYRFKSYKDVDGVRIYSTESDPVYCWNAAVSGVTAVQESANKIILTWNENEYAEKYAVYTADGTCVAETADTETELNVSAESAVYDIYIFRNTDGVEVKSGKTTIRVNNIVCENTLYFESYTVTDLKVELTLPAVMYADYYEIYRNSGDTDVLIATVTSESFTDSSVEYGTSYEYKFRVHYSTDSGEFFGNLSEAAVIVTGSKPVYRALLIGETEYTTKLNGPDNDVMVMEDILSAGGYDEIITETNATKDDIISLIEVAFIDATENDVSLFYYSGHGVTGADEYYSGALQTVDYAYITTEELAQILSYIPGKVIVILDSCGSGAAISDGTEAQSISLFGISEPDFDAEAFNDGVISAFSSYSYSKARSAELRQEKFYVLTGSAYEESSLSTYMNGMWGSLLMRSISASVGRDFNTGSRSGVLEADTDGNRIITLNELFVYCSEFTSGRQNVQVYPENSSMMVLDLT